MREDVCLGEIGGLRVDMVGAHDEGFAPTCGRHGRDVGFSGASHIGDAGAVADRICGRLGDAAGGYVVVPDHNGAPRSSVGLWRSGTLSLVPAVAWRVRNHNIVWNE